MKRVALAVGILAVISACFLAAGVTPARAGSPSQLTLENDPMWLGSDEDAIAALIRDLDNGPLISIPPGTTAWQNPATGSAVSSAEVESGMVGLEETTGVLPSLMQFGSIGLLGAGSIMAGYQIGNVFRQWIAGTSNDPGGGTATLTWKSFCPAGGNGVGGNCANTGPSTHTGFDTTGTVGSSWVSGWYLTSNVSPGLGSYCATGGPGGCSVAPAENTRLNTIADYLTSHHWATAVQAISDTNNCVTSGTYDHHYCRQIVMTDAQFARFNAPKTGNQSNYDSASVRKAYPGGNPTSVTNDNIVNNVRNECQNDTTDANIQGACMAIRYYIAPTYDPSTGTQPSTGGTTFAPFYIPSPFPGETVTDYAERLRSRTWVGAITTVDADMSVFPSGSPARQLSPGSLLSVTTGSDTANAYDPLTGAEEDWPLSPPKISTADQAVTIEEVPPDFVPDSGSGGPSIQFPNISFSCQFPFGFICWAQSVTGWFSVTPQAPDFDFTIPDETVGGHTYHVGSHYDVNLDVMDSYMTIFRGILTVVIWVGGIYFLAVRLLGFHPGGDPGEAIDDGMDLD